MRNHSKPGFILEKGHSSEMANGQLKGIQLSFRARACPYDQRLVLMQFRLNACMSRRLESRVAQVYKQLFTCMWLVLNKTLGTQHAGRLPWLTTLMWTATSLLELCAHEDHRKFTPGSSWTWLDRPWHNAWNPVRGRGRLWDGADGEGDKKMIKMSCMRCTKIQ